MYNIATPLPDTELFRQTVKAGIVPQDYWKNFLSDENYPRIPYLFKDAEKWVGKAIVIFSFLPDLS